MDTMAMPIEATMDMDIMAMAMDIMATRNNQDQK